MSSGWVFFLVVLFLAHSDFQQSLAPSGCRTKVPAYLAWSCSALGRWGESELQPLKAVSQFRTDPWVSCAQACLVFSVLRACLSGAGVKNWIPDVGLEHLTSQREALGFQFLPDCGFQAGEGQAYGRLCLSLSYLLPHGFLLSYL